MKYKTNLTQTRVYVKNGVVMIGSDAHYYPGIVSTAHRGFVKVASMLRPKILCLNGDVMDGASISRHPRIGWSPIPSVAEELGACKTRLAEIMKACPTAKRLWTYGNHCQRFNNYLSDRAGQFEGVKGFNLQDHFPLWKMSMTVLVNNSVIIKHRFRSGTHATYNNTVNAGLSIATGHLHALKVTPFTDKNGTRYGMDSGTLAALHVGSQFDYSEDNPADHRSGFLVLTFKNGVLMPPEAVQVIDESKRLIFFRGKTLRV